MASVPTCQEVAHGVLGGGGIFPISYVPSSGEAKQTPAQVTAEESGIIGLWPFWDDRAGSGLDYYWNK